MLLNAVPNPAGKDVKFEPSPLNDVAVTTPAFPKWILLPILIKSSISKDDAFTPVAWTKVSPTVNPVLCKFDEPVLKLDAEDIPVVLTWLWIWILPAWSNFKASLVSFICSVNWLSIPVGAVSYTHLTLPTKA